MTVEDYCASLSRATSLECTSSCHLMKATACARTLPNVNATMSNVDAPLLDAISDLHAIHIIFSISLEFYAGAEG